MDTKKINWKELETKIELFVEEQEIYDGWNTFDITDETDLFAKYGEKDDVWFEGEVKVWYCYYAGNREEPNHADCEIFYKGNLVLYNENGEIAEKMEVNEEI